METSFGEQVLPLTHGTPTSGRHLWLLPTPGGPEAEAPVPSSAPSRSVVPVAAALFVVAWLCFFAVNGVLRGRPVQVGFAGINDLLTTCAAVAAVVLGTLAMAQGLVSGVRARGFGMGVGLFLYGAVVLHLGRLYPLGGAGSAPEVIGYLPTSTLLVVIGLIGWSLVSGRELPPPWYRTTAALGVTVLALAAALQLVPTLAGVLTMATRATPATTAGSPGQLLVAGAWFAIAALSLRRQGTGRHLDPAVGIVALGLAQARLALALAPGGAQVWVLASHALQLVGLAIALGVVATEFRQRAARQRGQLLDFLVAACTDGARRQARQTIESGHRHDARSALLAADGAARMLADHSGELAEADRAALAHTVGAAVEQLGALMDLRVEEIDEFAVEAVARSVVHSERRSGMSVTLTVPPDLRSFGRAADLAVVVRTLLRSIRTCSGTHEVVLRGEQWGVAAVLLLTPAAHNLQAAADWEIVSAYRPGLDLNVRGDEGIFDLYVAARLMDEQGGDIWTTTHPGGGVSFAIRLPAARPTTAEVNA